MIAWTAKTIKHLPLDLKALHAYQREVAAYAAQYGTEERIVKLTLTQEEYLAMGLSEGFPESGATALLGIPFEVEGAR